jgi:hypothetical protein
LEFFKFLFTLFIFFLTISLTHSSTIIQEPEKNDQLIETILISLATKADNFERSLPDFIATEVLTQESLEIKNSKLLERSVIISRLTGRQLKVDNKKGGSQLDFQEFRQVQSINGKTVKVNGFKAQGPQVDGVFSSILLSHFASLDQNDYNFILDNELHTIRERPSYLIKFVSRPKVSERQFYFFEGKRIPSRQEGVAWIDKETLSPLRIEYKETNLPKNILSITYSVNYSTVQLGEETFLLPIEALSEIEEKKIINRISQQYSDYKKFSTDIKIE